MLENNLVLKFFKREFDSLAIYFSPYFSSFLFLFNQIKPFVVIILSIFIFLYLTYFVIKLYLSFKESKKQTVFFELTPPSYTEQSEFTTIQLFNSISGLLHQRSFIYRFFDINKSYSFEIVSTKEGGIKYLLRVLKQDSQIIKKSLIAYLPGIEIKKTEDYLKKTNNSKITEFCLSNNYIFPLKDQVKLKEYDPIAYITNTMTKLKDDELTSLQVIVSPISKSRKNQVNRIKSLFLAKKDIVNETKKGNILSSGFLFIFRLAIQILLFPIGLMIFIFTDGKQGPILEINPLKNNLPNSKYRQDIETQIKDKIDQPLLNVSFRLLISSDSKNNIAKIKNGFLAALSPFSNSSYQSLRARKRLKFKIMDKLSIWNYKNRIGSIFNNLILSVSEVSDLYHFPFTRTTKTENLSKLFSRKLPAPLSLKQKNKLDIYFAKNLYGGSETKIGLTADERRRHVYILGATGTGKSTMLLSMIKQDLENNKGLAVLDPHGDLIEQTLSIIPRDRLEDVIYFNPDDISYPIGINLLELTPNLDSESAIREKEFIAESIISVFHKIYTDKYSGPRMEYILRNTIHTAFTVPDATLFTVYKLLINTSFRKSVTRNLTDDNLKDFWRYEFAKAGDYQKVKMISPITNKIGRFLFSPTAKRILEQPKSTINFDQILNEGKILVANLSKGKIGEDNSNVFGVLLMAKIQLAALKRSRINQEKRRDFYLYVDEFQNFATPAFAQILSEARKYRLNAILAHQTTSQIEESSLVNVTLANTGTVICFRTANPEDERVILPQFQPYINKGEIASLPSYQFYMRLGAINPQEPFSGITEPVSIPFSQNRINEAIKSSRKLYAKKWVEEKKKAKKEYVKKKVKKVLKKTEFLP